jgi:GDP-4-dehydro-6-deoxy-D-mannose reductase
VPAAAPRFRILVTGGDGFVGRYLVPALATALPLDHEIVVGILNNNSLLPVGETRRVELDVTDAAQVCAILAAEQPTHVFHLAAIAAVRTAQLQVRQTWSVNFGGALNMALGVAETVPQCRLIYCGSGQVYGGNFRLGRAVGESTALDPIDAYGASKAAADLMVGQMAKQGLRAIRLRPFNHTGPGQREDFAVPAFAAQIARIERGEQQPVIRVGNLTGRRDLMDVRDVVDAYVRAILRFDELEPGCALNIASGQAISIGEILDILLSLSTKKIRVEPDAERMRGSDIAVMIGDAGLARRVLDWAPRLSISETLGAVLDYFRKL